MNVEGTGGIVTSLGVAVGTSRGDVNVGPSAAAFAGGRARSSWLRATVGESAIIKFPVTAGTNLSVVMSGTGDPDMFVKFGAEPGSVTATVTIADDDGGGFGGGGGGPGGGSGGPNGPGGGDGWSLRLSRSGRGGGK